MSVSDDRTGWDGLLSGLRGLNGHDVEIGLFDGMYEDGTTVPQVAFWHEFGTETMPARPLQVVTYERDKKQLANVGSEMLTSFIKGKSASVALSQFGNWYSDRMKYTIALGQGFAKLSPYTIKRKGHDHPLYETGRLVQSIKYKVK